jgi:hypothetical protein
VVADEHEERYVVRPATDGANPARAAPIPLIVKEVVHARLSILFRCRLDRSGAFLAVEHSAFKLFTPASNPLVRLEFDQGQAPASHWHVHADRTALGSLLNAAHRQGPHDVARLHLPAGGTRMRPCLEDFIEFLIRDLGADWVPGWEGVVAEGREVWRRRQIRTAARDAPEDAATTLRALGYAVTAPPAPVAENRVALRGY